jgi:hypothetical protein
MLRSLSIFGLVATAALVTTVSACGSSSPRNTFGDDGAGPGGSSGNGGGTITGDGKSDAGDPEAASECEKMDIVFIVDDSGSMSEEQSNLAANFPKFVNVLDTFKTKSGAKLDYRLAVTTTGRDVKYTMSVPILGSIPADEKGDNGAFRNTSTCGSGKRWIDRADSDVMSRFSCLAEVGTSGPSIEMPLYSLQLALNDRMADGTNTGFLRPDALLATIILTDEDDCSRVDNDFVYQGDGLCDTTPESMPIANFTSMLDSVAGGAGRWATAVIAGDKSCSSSFGDAAPATRLKKFVAAAGKNGTFSSICDGDLSIGLQNALNTFDAACRSFPGPK